MMLTAMILYDMALLALEIWLSFTWLGITAALCVVYIGVKVLAGASWMVHTALVVAAASALFILAQAGQSAWGANLMIYLLPIQIANAVALVAAFMVTRLWRRAS